MNYFYKQGIKYSVIGYFGFFIGTFSSIFIYPMNYKFYGTIRYILSLSEIIFPFILFGISQANVRFYHQLKKKNKHHQLLSFSIIFSIIIFIFSYTIHPIIEYYLPNLYFWKYKNIIFILTILLGINQIINRYLTNLKHIVISGIIDSIIPKIASLVSFCYFIFYNSNDLYSLNILIIFFIFSSYLYWRYLKKIEIFIFSLNFKFLKDNRFYKSLFKFSFFSLLGTIGSILALRIDSLMIMELIGEKFNGYYATYLSILSLLSIPTLGIYKISMPIIRKYIINNKFFQLNKFYQKSSFILFFWGSFLFCLICSSIELIFHLIKNGEELIPYLSIIYILGTAMLFDLATGFNSYILLMSNYYRYNIYFMLYISIINISLNYLFIKYFNLGIIGIAYATSISLIIYNITKLVFNYKKFKLYPFSIQMLKVIPLIFISLICTLIFPKCSNLFFNLFLNFIIILLVFFVGNQRFKIISLNIFKYKKICSKILFLLKMNRHY